MSDGVVNLSFPARTEFLLLPRLALAGIARGIEIPEEVLADLKLAVTEACGNAARHAYAEGREGTVRVSFGVGVGSIEISVEDDGVGLPAADGGGPGEEGELEVEGGMGLSIIEAIADELVVGRTHGTGGTHIVMRKSLVLGAGSTQ